MDRPGVRQVLEGSGEQRRMEEIAYEVICGAPMTLVIPRRGELRTQKLKSHLMRTQSLNVLPLKPGVDECTAIYATLTARDFFLAYFYLFGPFTYIFLQNLSRFFLCLLWLTPVPV